MSKLLVTILLIVPVVGLHAATVVIARGMPAPASCCGELWKLTCAGRRPDRNALRDGEQNLRRAADGIFLGRRTLNPTSPKILSPNL